MKKIILNQDIDKLEALSKSKLVEALKENYNIILSSVSTKTELQARLLDISRHKLNTVNEINKKQLEQIAKNEIIYMLKLFAGKAALKYYRVYFDKETLERVL